MTTTNKKSIKNVESANVVKNARANEKVSSQKTAKEILTAAAIATQGLLKSSLGTKKSSLYREGVLPEDAKEKKSTRKRLRNYFFSIASSLIAEEDTAKQSKLISAFNEFYFSTYANNDYTLASVCNENLSSEKKDIIKKALEICKK